MNLDPSTKPTPLSMSSTPALKRLRRAPDAEFCTLVPKKCKSNYIIFKVRSRVSRIRGTLASRRVTPRACLLWRRVLREMSHIIPAAPSALYTDAATRRTPVHPTTPQQLRFAICQNSSIRLDPQHCCPLSHRERPNTRDPSAGDHTKGTPHLHPKTQRAPGRHGRSRTQLHLYRTDHCIDQEAQSERRSCGYY